MVGYDSVKNAHSKNKARLHTESLPRICGESKCLEVALAHNLYCSRHDKINIFTAIPPSPLEYGEKFIYFIQTESNTVKIGKTEDLSKRFNVLQSANADTLTLAASVIANESLEVELHELLKDSSIRGEWFKATDDVLAVINAAKENGLNGIYRIIRERFKL